jgi:4-hydroxyphenylpyruvate dioxygenase
MKNLTQGKKYDIVIDGIDHIELYVGNALQAAHYYRVAFGFQPLAKAGLYTGKRTAESYVLEQGKIRLVLTSPLQSDTTVGKHIDLHGDGVKIIALTVEDATRAYEHAIANGARAYAAPQYRSDHHGGVMVSGVYTYGETVHLFVERKKYKGPFLPGYQSWETPEFSTPEIGLKYIDHMVGNVGWGQMNQWVDYYKKIFGFKQIISFDDKDISTEYTALMSKVVSDGKMRVKFPINEPAKGKKRSQVEEYLDFYEGEGVQHIAVATDNIIHTIHSLRKNGVEFLEVPDTYYETVHERVGEINEDLTVLKKLGILIDRDDEGYLLQLFTKPIGPRPTLFFEIIQRNGATSFGKGNFKALFEAIERDQVLRGTL